MILEQTLDTFLAAKPSDVAVPAAITKRLTNDAVESPHPMVNRITPYLAATVANDLQLPRIAPARLRNKRRLIAAYIDDCDRMNEAAAEFHRFLYDCVFASLVYGGQQGQGRQGVENTLLNATELLVNRFQSPLVPNALQTDARLVVTSDVPKLYESLIGSLEDACYSLVDNMFAMLQFGVDNYVFGEVKNVMDGETLDDGRSSAVQYSYFTRRLTDAYRYTHTRDTADQAIDTAMHLHDVVNARLVPLPARGVAKPRWIPPLLDAVPSMFRAVPGAVTVLTGDIVLERVSVRTPTVDDHRVNQYPMHCDPALVIANTFVLTGWNPTDIRNRTKLRQWTPDEMKKSPPWHETSLVVDYRRRVLGRPNRPRLADAWKVGR